MSLNSNNQLLIHFVLVYILFTIVKFTDVKRVIEHSLCG